MGLIDAAGGHGALALAFKASGQIDKAIVADIYEPRAFHNLRTAWLDDASSAQQGVCHQYTDLRTPGWLTAILQREGISPSDAAVVACHACGVLTDELIRDCIAAQVSFAIMPCCHGERSARGAMIRDLQATWGIHKDLVYDPMRWGVIDASPGYTAKLRTIDPAITPKNHILIGIRESKAVEKKQRQDRLDDLERKAMHSAIMSARRLSQ